MRKEYGRIFKAITALMSISITVVSVPSAASAAVDDKRSDITGSVFSPTGEALGGVDVVAAVEPDAQKLFDAPAGTVSVPKTVGVAKTDASGHFELTLTDLEQVNRAADADGLVSIILSGNTPNGYVYYRTRMLRTPSGDFAAYQPDIDSSAVESNAAESNAVAPKRAQSRAIRLGKNGAELRLFPLRSPVDPTDKSAKSVQAAAVFDPNAACLGFHWYYKKVDGTAGKNVTIINQSTGAKTTGEFTYETSNSTSLEAGVTGTNHELVASTGYMKGQTTTGTIDLPIGKSTNAEWYVGYDFQLWDLYCGSTGVDYRSGYTEERPYRWDGGGSHRSWTPFACSAQNQSTIGAGGKITFSSNLTTTKTGSFSVGSNGVGLNMKLQQTWSGTQKLQYAAINSTTSYTICGDTGKWNTGVARTRQT